MCVFALVSDCCEVRAKRKREVENKVKSQSWNPQRLPYSDNLLFGEYGNKGGEFVYVSG